MLHVSGQAMPPAVRVREAIPLYAPLRGEDRGYTDLRTSKLGRDLDYTQWRKSVDLGFYLYRTNPLAHRIIEMDISFILGSAITFQTPSAETKAIIRDFWLNRYNRWPKNIFRRVRDLLIYGEWFHYPVVSRHGQTFINPYQPTLIQETVVSPYNHEIIDSVIIRSYTNNELREQRIPIIRPNFNESTERLDGYVGAAFLFGINQTTDTTRGIGELFTLIDGLDVFEEMIFSRAEKVAQASMVWWDLKLEGYNQTQIDDFLIRETDRLPPKSGTVWGHNEKAELLAKFPDTQADQHSADVLVQKSHIVSSAGFPGTFFDEPGSAGRAVGAEMSEPTFKGISSLQAQIAHFLREEIDYALEAAIQHNALAQDAVDWEYTISFGSPNARDIQRIGPAMARLVQAATQAVAGKIMTQEQAAALLAAQINQLGLSDVPMLIDDMFEDPEFARKVKNQIQQQENPQNPQNRQPRQLPNPNGKPAPNKPVTNKPDTSTKASD